MTDNFSRELELSFRGISEQFTLDEQYVLAQQAEEAIGTSQVPDEVVSLISPWPWLHLWSELAS
jgi:hypothetical protein